MKERFRICLCHPKLIGLFYKDSFKKVFAYIISLFLLFIGVSAAVAYNTDHFGYEEARSVASIVCQGEESNVLYDSTTKTISGTGVKYEEGNIVVNFLVEENYATSQKLIFRFKAEYVDVIFYGYVLKSVSYEDFNIDSFSISNVQNGNRIDMIEFQDFINVVLNQVNSEYATFYFVEAIMVGIMYFVMVFVLALVSSYFVNPKITGKVRIKLCFYSVGIFYFLMILSLMFNAGWLQYVAMFLPFIYSNITFMHIIKVEKKN